MDEWPFWMFEENIKLVNEIVEEEENSRKKQEQDQQKECEQNVPYFPPRDLVFPFLYLGVRMVAIDDLPNRQCIANLWQIKRV